MHTGEMISVAFLEGNRSCEEHRCSLNVNVKGRNRWPDAGSHVDVRKEVSGCVVSRESRGIAM